MKALSRINYHKVVRNLIGLILIGTLLNFFFKDFTWVKVYKEFGKLNFLWLAIILIITIICHFIRAWRWKLLIEATGIKTKFWPVLEAIMLGYFVNLGLPRAGEITRCVTLNNTQNIPISTSLGTVLSERISDVIFLALLTLLALFTNVDQSVHYIEENLLQPLKEILRQMPWQRIAWSFGALLILAVALIYWLFFKYRGQLSKKISLLLTSFWEGASGILKSKSIGLFILQSAIIWTFYYFMTYLWFKAYAPAQSISMVAGLAIVTVGNLARTIPLPAGSAGAYHILMAGVLILYGLSEDEGKFLAASIHAVQTSFYLVVGIGFSVVYSQRLRLKIG